MNKRILRALRAGNEFQAEWYRAQRHLRCGFYTAQEIGNEGQQKCITNRSNLGREGI